MMFMSAEDARNKLASQKSIKISEEQHLIETHIERMIKDNASYFYVHKVLLRETIHKAGYRVDDCGSQHDGDSTKVSV